jgi:hypothetical protein
VGVHYLSVRAANPGFKLQGAGVETIAS